MTLKYRFHREHFAEPKIGLDCGHDMRVARSSRPAENNLILSGITCGNQCRRTKVHTRNGDGILMCDTEEKEVD